MCCMPVPHIFGLSVCLQLMLSSDEGAFGGFENLSKKYNTEFASETGDYDGRPNSIKVSRQYLCCHLCCEC